VGFAISRIDEQEAREIFSYLDQIDALGEADAAGDVAEPPR
jgi:hydrogenase maturation factor